MVKYTTSNRRQSRKVRNVHLAHTYLKDICSSRFIAALFVIAKTRKQPRHPSAEERIKKT